MARIIVVTSGKGGVGKTTSSAAIATGLAQKGRKTVVIVLISACVISTRLLVANAGSFTISSTSFRAMQR